MDANKALNIVAAQCSKKEYCTADVYQKLLRWELNEKEAAAIMDFLVKNHFVDDERFAEAYVLDKARFNRWGRLKIARMLRVKQIPDAIVERALALLPDEETEETCLSLLRQKAKGLKESDPYKRKAKLYRFALGRGFSHDTISRCLANLDY